MINIDLTMIEKILKVNPEILIRRIKKKKKAGLQTLGLIMLYGTLNYLKNEIDEAIKEEENTINIEGGKSNEI